MTEHERTETMKASDEQRLEIGDSILWVRRRSVENAPGEIVKEWNVNISPTSYRLGYNSGVTVGIGIGFVFSVLIFCLVIVNILRGSV